MDAHEQYSMHWARLAHLHIASHKAASRMTIERHRLHVQASAASDPWSQRQAHMMRPKASGGRSISCRTGCATATAAAPLARFSSSIWSIAAMLRLTCDAMHTSTCLRRAAQSRRSAP